MSYQEESKRQGLVKKYLRFLDTNVLFKKPVSCVFALLSLLIPVYFLVQSIKLDFFKSEPAELFLTAVFFLVVLIIAGVFGSLIWWHRRIIHDAGPKWYNNFRRFIQTFGEWTATVFAIVVFFGVIIFFIFAREYYNTVTQLLPFAFPAPDVTAAFFGPAGGFLIIIGVKIFLFILDLIIWLIKKIWILFKRIVMYYYRFVTNVHHTLEQNTPVWIGVIWLISILVIICGLILCYKFFTVPGSHTLIGAVSIIALGLAFMGFLVVKRKNYDA